MAERTLPQTKNELLNDIESEWSDLMVTVEKLTPEQMVTPDSGGWSPKDNLAHLSEWMKILMGYHMDKRPAAEVAGIDQAVADRWDFNEINRIFFERNRNRSVDDVFDELKLVYSEVVNRLESMPFEEMLKPRFADDPGRGPLLLWILNNTSEHFAEHRINIEKAVARPGLRNN